MLCRDDVNEKRKQPRKNYEKNVKKKQKKCKGEKKLVELVKINVMEKAVMCEEKENSFAGR